MISFDGGVCKQSRWLHSVTEPSQDGGYALLWQSYDNNKMVAMRYYGNVMTTTMSQHSDNVFYIFNSTVIDWTCYIFILDLTDKTGARKQEPQYR